jgi:hypothetical protein
MGPANTFETQRNGGSRREIAEMPKIAEIRTDLHCGDSGGEEKTKIGNCPK